MSRPIRGLRWYIVAMLCLATTLNYLDRQTLSVLAGTIKTELGISTVEYSHITSAFLISYMIMYAVSGRIIDKLGTRRSFIVFVTGWSVANALHAFARTALQFSVFRFLLGATEPANFPAGVKTVSEWFPVRERALAIGIFNSGTAIGAALAPPLAATCTLLWGWRSAFVAGGAIGGLWVVAWMLIYRVPREHPRLSEGERRLIEGHETTAAKDDPRIPISQLLRMRETWGCLLARMLTDPISYFFIFWTPLFLQEARGFNLADIGKYSGIPFMASAVGNILGGMIPGWLVRQGWSLDRARKMVMGSASLVIPACCVLIVRVPTPVAAVTLMSVAMFCHAAWANMTLPAEVFPKQVVATVSGFGGALGGLMGAISQQLIGWTVQNVSFTPVFAAIAFLPLLAFILTCLLVRQLGEIRRISAA